MNWQRGLLRLWILMSVAWVGLIGFLAYGDESLTTIYRAPTQEESATCIAKLPPQLGNQGTAESGAELLRCGAEKPVKAINYTVATLFAGEALVPPVLLLFLGFAIGWVLLGFKPARNL